MSAMILLTLAAAGLSAAPTAAPQVPLYTHELALSREPKPFPFTAIYVHAGKQLAFVAARHENGDATATVAAIKAAFASVHPDFVVVEGFPSSLGESPAAMVSIAMSRGKPDANPFAASEAMFAAEQAIGAHVPFVGGEPSDAAQVAALTARGFDPGDILFADIMKVFPQFIRAGQISGPADPKFAVLYGQISETLAHNRGVQPMSLSEFERRYRAAFAVDPSTDAQFANRANPDGANPVGRILAAEGQVRDEALLALITDALVRHRRVLVVYGGSHWTTLSGSLQTELGKPQIT